MTVHRAALPPTAGARRPAGATPLATLATLAALVALALLSACASDPPARSSSSSSSTSSSSSSPPPRPSSAALADLEKEEQQLYVAGGRTLSGLQGYLPAQSNYAEHRGPQTVGSHRMQHVAPRYTFVQIYVKQGASGAAITRAGTYAAQVRDVFVYPMALKSPRQRGSESLAEAVRRFCPAPSGYLPSDSAVASDTHELERFLKSKLGDDGPKIWRYHSPSMPHCALMDFG